jgi:hypothetical protein
MVAALKSLPSGPVSSRSRALKERACSTLNLRNGFQRVDISKRSMARSAASIVPACLPLAASKKKA